MPNFRKYNYNQDAMVVVNFKRQLKPNTFEFTLHHLIDNHIDLSAFYEKYSNDLGNSRVGPNPVNTSETCELWTYDRSVYSAALAALMSGKKVSVTYVDRGEGTYWCKVRHFSVLAN